MSDTVVNRRNLSFLVHEVFEAGRLTESGYYDMHDAKLFDRVIAAALTLAGKQLRPILEEMDRHPPELVDGSVRVLPEVKKLMAEYGRGGWIGMGFPESHDGEQLPVIITSVCRFIFAAANYSASVYPELTAGAAELILTFGSKMLVDTYVPRMLEGRWQGTMALTEPQAGSSLSDLTTSATPTPEGYYLIRGRKTFISAGDHDGVENVVHLMLARMDGAPPGTRGISLFVVPKYRPRNDGDLTSNDVRVAGVYHKLGYRGAPITELAMGDGGDCRGWLVGEAHSGLAAMFQMMNEARIGVGLGACAIASAAFHAALDYTKTRCQGRSLLNKDPVSPQIPIIQHADVKRMLLFQKAMVEGSLSLILQCCLYADMIKTTAGDEKKNNQMLLDLLTPVAKSYPSEMGITSASTALQCFGGYGYCDDFPVEQYYRDIRIHPIHEGTTGVQAMDLLGRKLTMEKGRAALLFSETVNTTIEEARLLAPLVPLAEDLSSTMDLLRDVIGDLMSVAAKQGPELFLSDATLFLECFGHVAIGWQWLKQAIVARKALDKGCGKGDTAFYTGKLMTASYFFRYELPKTLGLARRLKDSDSLTLDMQPDYF